MGLDPSGDFNGIWCQVDLDSSPNSDTCCVASDKLLNFSGLQFPCLQNIQYSSLPLRVIARILSPKSCNVPCTVPGTRNSDWDCDYWCYRGWPRHVLVSTLVFWVR